MTHPAQLLLHTLNLSGPVVHFLLRLEQNSMLHGDRDDDDEDDDDDYDDCYCQ